MRKQSVRKWVQRDLERLAFAEIAVPRRYSIHTWPDTLFPRECFPRACYYVELHRIKGIQYVLGKAVSGGFGEHGWVELPGNVVFDGVLQRFYDRDKYYQSEHAMPWYKFTRTAVCWLLAKHLTTWRWDLCLGLPWAKSASDRTAESRWGAALTWWRLGATVKPDAEPCRVLAWVKVKEKDPADDDETRRPVWHRVFNLTDVVGCDHLRQKQQPGVIIRTEGEIDINRAWQFIQNCGAKVSSGVGTMRGIRLQATESECRTSNDSTRNWT